MILLQVHLHKQQNIVLNIAYLLHRLVGNLECSFELTSINFFLIHLVLFNIYLDNIIFRIFIII